MRASWLDPAVNAQDEFARLSGRASVDQRWAAIAYRRLEIAQNVFVAGRVGDGGATGIVAVGVRNRGCRVVNAVDRPETDAVVDSHERPFLAVDFEPGRQPGAGCRRGDD